MVTQKRVSTQLRSRRRLEGLLEPSPGAHRGVAADPCGHRPVRALAL